MILRQYVQNVATGKLNLTISDESIDDFDDTDINLDFVPFSERSQNETDDLFDREPGSSSSKFANDINGSEDEISIENSSSDEDDADFWLNIIKDI